MDTEKISKLVKQGPALFASSFFFDIYSVDHLFSPVFIPKVQKGARAYILAVKGAFEVYLFTFL